MRKFLPVIIILALLGAGAFYWFYYKPKHDHAPVKLFGNVEIREAEASFRQAGRIKDILVDEGDKVQEGQVLAELETDTFMDAMAASDAEIALANSDLTKLKNGSRPEEIAIAKDNVALTKAALDNAQTEYARQAALAPSGAVAQKIVDGLKAQRDMAQANYQTALDALKLRQNGARKEDLMAGQSRLQGAQANRRKIQTALDDTKLYAPVSGIIVAKPKEKGAIVAPNVAVFTISIQDPIYIRAYVSEKELAKLRFREGISLNELKAEMVDSWNFKRYLLDLSVLTMHMNQASQESGNETLVTLKKWMNCSERDLDEAIYCTDQFLLENNQKVSYLNDSNSMELMLDSVSKRWIKILGRNKDKLAQEIKQSKELVFLIRKSASEELTKEEKEKVKTQFMDIAKSMPALAIFLLPGGALLLPIVLKIIPNLVPSAFKDNELEE